MKILQVIPTLNPSAGGPVEGAIQQGLELVDGGHAVETLSLDEPGHEIDVRVASTHIHFLGPKKWGYAYATRLEPWLQKHAREYDVIVVHGMWQYLGYCVSKVARSLDVPYVLFLHGMLDPWFAKRYPLKHLKKWLYWPWAEYRTIRDARLVLFTTAEELTLARQSFWLYKARERLVGYGIRGRETELTQLGNVFLGKYPRLAGGRNLLYLSRIHPKKGCDLLIRAFARVADSDPSLHLVMAGPDQTDWVPELIKMAQELGIANRVTFTGMLTGAMKWGAYDASEMFILPSHQENFGIVVAEALASGLPVLTTYKVNIWREIHGANAGIIHPDTQAGTDKLLADWLAMTTKQKAEMRVNAKHCFKVNFEAAQVTQKLIEALEFAAFNRKIDHTYKGNILRKLKSNTAI